MPIALRPSVFNLARRCALWARSSGNYLVSSLWIEARACFRFNRSNRVIGERYELRARRYLEARGLRTLARNYQCRNGEIDLIMRDGAELVFVEVRMRSSEHFGGAAQSVGIDKRRKLRRAINSYLSRYSYRPPFRFDLVAFEPGRDSEPDWWRALQLA